MPDAAAVVPARVLNHPYSHDIHFGPSEEFPYLNFTKFLVIFY